jgi:hypothetical protein
LLAGVAAAVYGVRAVAAWSKEGKKSRTVGSLMWDCGVKR